MTQSKEKGIFFSSRLVRYDNQMFSFESLPQDYFVLINHFIKKLSEIKTVPDNKLIEELDKIKMVIEDIKKEHLKSKKWM